MIALLAAAATMTMPVLTGGDTWSWRVSNPFGGRSGFAVSMELVIDTNGRAVACRILSSSGRESTDKLVCRVPTITTLFQPAVDTDGRPIAAATKVGYSVDKPGPLPEQSIDLGIPVDRVPAAATNPFLAVLVVTDAKGKVERCLVSETSGNAQLDALACPAIARDGLAPVEDAKHRPLRALRRLRVGFTAVAKVPPPPPPN